MTEKSADLSAIKGVSNKGAMRPTKEHSKDLQRRLEALEAKFDANYVRPVDTADSGIHTGDGQDGSGRARNDYPVRMYPRDPNDQLVQLKLGAHKDFGVKTLTDVDLKWMRQKMLDQQSAAQKQFVMAMYDSRDPAQRQIRDRVFPDLVREQEAIIDERIELERRLAKISLHGPQGKEDIDLLYALSSGAVALPEGVAWDPKSWFPAGVDQLDMSRGIFSPLRVKVGNRKKSQLPFDMLGSATGVGATGIGFPWFTTQSGLGAQTGLSIGPGAGGLGPMVSPSGRLTL